jgi:hypothetical protein
MALVLILSAPAAASAEVRIEGSAEAVRVSTNQDTIADVLSALSAAFKLRYQSAVPLSAAADPTYSGSVRQVIAHLLDGYSYVVKFNKEATEIIVLGSRGEIVVPPPMPAAKAAAPPDVVSRWR